MNIINKSLGFVKTHDSRFSPDKVFRVLEYSDTSCFVLHEKKRLELSLSVIFQDFECYLNRKQEPKKIANKIIT